MINLSRETLYKRLAMDLLLTDVRTHTNFKIRENIDLSVTPKIVNISIENLTIEKESTMLHNWEIFNSFMVKIVIRPSYTKSIVSCKKKNSLHRS